MNLIRMTIFHLKRLIENATDSLYDDWNASLINGMMLAPQGTVDTKAPSTVAKPVTFVFKEGNGGVPRIDCAVYPRRECVTLI